MIRELEKIKSMEEYIATKKSLEYCISEYKWIMDAKNPKQEIEDEIKACSTELKVGMDEKDEFQLLNKIHLLKTKYISIVQDKYKPALKRNINAFVLMLEQFEAANKEMKFGDVVKGIVSGSPEVKEHLRKKYMFSFANMYGTTPAPESLNVESMDDILEYMDRNYELVDIDLSDRKEARDEVGLTLFEEAPLGMKAALLKSIEKTVDDGIEKYSATVPSKEEVKVALRNVGANKEQENNKSHEENERKVSKQEGEIEI